VLPALQIPQVVTRTAFDNSTRKAVDELTGICKGILADGVVCDAEAEFFRDWLTRHPAVVREWPFRQVAARVAAIFSDGRIDQDERGELVEIMQQIVGTAPEEELFQDCSTHLPLDEPQPQEIVLRDRGFCLTGRFASLSRRGISDLICEAGGWMDSSVMATTHYLAVGAFASPAWKQATYGTKIERAVERRTKSGTPNTIAEETLMRALTAARV
jgi:NAD-dependent DNA ligase